VLVFTYSLIEAGMHKDFQGTLDLLAISVCYRAIMFSKPLLVLASTVFPHL
jgi:hypothetical protein